MSPVEELLTRAILRHMREINLAANVPPARPCTKPECPHCHAVLTVSEIAERWCNSCCKTHEVSA
ncbi:hypothetical protein FB480_101883 [Agrobacterium vitis]|nr:hypothetical protein FB480_101883 [Agrobacterium vitis]